MASSKNWTGIRRRETARGTVRWDVRYRDPQGRQKTKTCNSEDEAVAFQAKNRLSVREGTYVDRSAGRMTLRQFVEGSPDQPGSGWLAAQHQHRPTTRLILAGVVRNHLTPLMGLSLANIDRPTVQAWVNGLVPKLSPGSLNQVYMWLSAILEAAVLDGRLARNPCVRIKRPPIEKRRVEAITLAEVRLMADAIAPRYRALVLLGAATGMRHAELLGLTADHIRGLTVVVDRQITAQRTFARPKSNAGVRTLPIDEATAGMLAQHMAIFPPLGSEGFVFHNGIRPLTNNRFNEVWQAARVACGVQAKPHDLRHFYASALIRAGLDVKTVQYLMGHENARVTLDIYGHMWPDAQDRTRAALATILTAPD